LLSFSYDSENWQLKFITTGIGSMDTYMALTILVLQFTRSIFAGILSSAGELKTS
jgi:hypothetical protein